MALTQASMVEEILPRQERAIVRSVYRASIIADAQKVLNQSVQFMITGIEGEKRPLTPDTMNQIARLSDFLRTSYINALITTKIPVASILAIEVLPPSK